LPWESQLPLKPYLSLQPFIFEGNCNSFNLLLDSYCCLLPTLCRGQLSPAPLAELSQLDRSCLRLVACRQSRLSAVSAAAKSAGTAAAAAVAVRTGMFRFYLDTRNMTGEKLVLFCPILYLSGWDVNPCRRFRFKAVVRMNNAHGNQCNHQPY